MNVIIDAYNRKDFDKLIESLTTSSTDMCTWMHMKIVEFLLQDGRAPGFPRRSSRS
jgi:hypothetical protein